MAPNPAPTGSAHRSHALKAGQVVGGRFRVEREVSQDALGPVLRAQDTKTGKPLVLRVLEGPSMRSAEVASALRAQCRVAAQLTHPHIVATYGVGNLGPGRFFVACEWVDGIPLSAAIANRQQQGQPLSLGGAYRVIFQASQALLHARAKTAHATLRPSVIWLTSAGVVRIADYGVGKAVVQAAGAASLGPTEQACLAPEVKAGSIDEVHSDVFGLGALFYEMVTGCSPAQGFVPPSQARPDASPELDRVLLRCLAADPSARFQGPDEVCSALLPLVQGAPTVEPEQEFGVPVQGPSGLPSGTKAPRASAARGAAVPPSPGPASRPQVGARVSINEEFRAPSPQGPVWTDPKPEQAPVAEVDLKNLVAKITENDAARWMVVKDKLDHGPFSGRELVELILKGDVLAEHRLLNMDTGERRDVANFPEFTEFLEQYRARRDHEAHQAALQRSAKAEKASNVAKILTGAAILTVLVAAVVTFLLTRESAEEELAANLDARADLFERGEIEITGTAGILPRYRRARGARRRGRRARRAASSSGNPSYEDAMNQAVNLGDATQGGGERQLTSRDVAGVMNRHINSLFGCVGKELRKGGALSKVQIDLAIAGGGNVLGASVRQGSAGFQSCIAARVQRIRFPSFPAPRMGARYSFSVD